MLAHERVQARLVDGHPSCPEILHAAGVDVAQGHGVAERRQAHTRDQADIAGPDDPDALRRRRHVAGGHSVRPSVWTGMSVPVTFLGNLARLSGRMDLMISSIVLALILAMRVLVTQ